MSVVAQFICLLYRWQDFFDHTLKRVSHTKTRMADKRHIQKYGNNTTLVNSKKIVRKSNWEQKRFCSNAAAVFCVEKCPELENHIKASEFLYGGKEWYGGSESRDRDTIDDKKQFVQTSLRVTSFANLYKNGMGLQNVSTDPRCIQAGSTSFIYSECACVEKRVWLNDRLSNGKDNGSKNLKSLFSLLCWKRLIQVINSYKLAWQSCWCHKAIFVREMRFSSISAALQ
jgi:hypothetical protein